MKNKNNGFTLIEIVVALGIVAMLAGLSLASMSILPKAKAKEGIEMIRSKYMLTREYAQTHAGEGAYIELTYELPNADPSAERSEYVNQIKIETLQGTKKTVDYLPKETALKYNCGEFDENGRDTDRLFGIDDCAMVTGMGKPTIKIMFNEDGKIIGPSYVNWIAITYGKKKYSLMFTEDGNAINGYEFADAMIRDDAGTQISNNTQLAADWAYANGGTGAGNVIDNKDLPTLLIDNKSSAILSYKTEKDKDGNLIAVPQQPNVIYNHDLMRIGGVYRAKNKNKYTMTFTLKQKDKIQVFPDSGLHQGFRKIAPDVLALDWEIK